MFLAFGLIALVTVLSSTASWFVYDDLARSLSTIAGSDIPSINLASELSAKSGEIVRTAPTLVAANSKRARAKIWQRLSQVIKKTELLVDRLQRHDIPAGRRESLAGQLSAVTSALRGLDRNAQRKLWFARRNHDLTERLRWAHADFLDEVDPLIVDARFNLELLFRRSNPSRRPAEHDRAVAGDVGAARNVQAASDVQAASVRAGLRQQEVLLQIKADVNLLVGMIFRAAGASDERQMNTISLFANNAADRVKSGLGRLASEAENISLRQSAKVILTYVNGANSLFDLRRDDLKLRRESADLLNAAAVLVARFQSSAGRMAELVKEQATRKAENASRITGRAKQYLVWASLGSIAIAISVVWFYVGRNLVGRVRTLSASMGRIADGDLAAEVATGGDDEIADMAVALEVFRNRISETQRELVQAGKLAALGQLAAGVAHDLNQPLAAMKFQAHNAGVLLRQERTREAQRNLDKISELSIKMARKIKHLKTLARKPSESISDVDIKGVISSSLDLLQGRISNEAVEVIERLPPRPLMVRGGENRLEQVFLNVFGNALDAMANASERQLLIEAKKHDGVVKLSVRDSGCGIAMEAARQVFDPFFTTKDVGEGLGLGLSISYNIVKDFGGSITIDTSCDSGSCFVITLQAAMKADLRKSFARRDRVGA